VNGAQVSDGLDLAGTEGVESEDDPWSRPTGLLWPILIGAVAASWLDRLPRRRRTAVVVLAAVFVSPLGHVLLHLFGRFLSLPCMRYPVVAGWSRVRVPGFESFRLYRIPPSAPAR
jgi:hypothetical protein